jgi:hypothetical protein
VTSRRPTTALPLGTKFQTLLGLSSLLYTYFKRTTTACVTIRRAVLDTRLRIQGTDKLYERILDAHAKPGDKMEVYCLTNYLLVPEGLSKHVEAALVRAGV